MQLAVWVCRDFTVTDARRLLAAARAACIELNSGATPDEAAQMVTSAADAIVTLLERDGLFGRAADTAHADHGLLPEAGRVQATAGEMYPLPPGPDCSERGGVLALPADADRA